VTDDKDLRSELERLASSVGDPPEHGLERVAARRHRRLRRRRGAVATAAVLAVLTVAALAIVQRPERRDTVTASGSARPTGAPPELPREIEIVCDPAGIVVPVASARPERDGLHVRVTNALGVPTTVRVDGDDWASGDIAVPVTGTPVRLPVPPGELTVGCDIGGRMERRRVDLVDRGGYYQTPELACDDADVRTLHDLPVPPAASDNIIPAARAALDAHLVGGTDGDGIGPVRGYQSQRLSDPTADPVVQVTRDGDVVAFAHVRGAGDATTPPWVTVSEAEVCAPVVATPAGPSTTAPRPPPTTGPPPPP
jgi:hypothetical protein